MASDTGTAKAKDNSKDSSPVQSDNTRKNSSPIPAGTYTSAQKDNTIPVQNSSTSTSVRRDNTSSQTSNADASSNRNDLSSTPTQRNSAFDAQKNASLSEANSVNVPVNPEASRLYTELHSKVADRAYELYEQDGASHGDDLHHWLRAESEILQRIPEIHQTDSTYSVIAALDGFGAEDISVTVEPNRALILADKQRSSDAKGFDNSVGSHASRRSVFFATDWPGQVDPATATAHMQQGNLILTVKRAGTISRDSKSSQMGH